MRLAAVFLVLGAAMLVFLGCAEPTPPVQTAPEPRALPEPEPRYLSAEKVRELIYQERQAKQRCGFDSDEWTASMFRLGDRAFPGYEAILADPQSDAQDIHLVYRFIFYSEADRLRFGPILVRRLADSDAMLPAHVFVRGMVRDGLYWNHGPAVDPATLAGRVIRCALELSLERNRVRLRVIALLGAIGYERGADLVATYLRHEESDFRLVSAWALSRIGTMSHLNSLDECLKADEPRRDLQERLKVKECRDELEKRLKSNPPQLKDRME
jgi:hypothetical protein